MGKSVWIEVAGADQDMALFIAYVRAQLPAMESSPDIKSTGSAGRRHHTIRFRLPDDSDVTEAVIMMWLRRCFLPRARVSLIR